MAGEYQGDDPIMELLHALDSAIDERNRGFKLLQRFLADHKDMARLVHGHEICECALCIEARFLLAGVRVNDPPK